MGFLQLFLNSLRFFFCHTKKENFQRNYLRHPTIMVISFDHVVETLQHVEAWTCPRITRVQMSTTLFLESFCSKPLKFPLFWMTKSQDRTKNKSINLKPAEIIAMIKGDRKTSNGKMQELKIQLYDPQIWQGTLGKASLWVTVPFMSCWSQDWFCLQHLFDNAEGIPTINKCSGFCDTSGNNHLQARQHVHQSSDQTVAGETLCTGNCERTFDVFPSHASIGDGHGGLSAGGGVPRSTHMFWGQSVTPHGFMFSTEQIHSNNSSNSISFSWHFSSQAWVALGLSFQLEVVLKLYIRNTESIVNRWPLCYWWAVSRQLTLILPHYVVVTRKTLWFISKETKGSGQTLQLHQNKEPKCFSLSPKNCLYLTQRRRFHFHVSWNFFALNWKIKINAKTPPGKCLIQAQSVATMTQDALYLQWVTRDQVVRVTIKSSFWQ